MCARQLSGGEGQHQVFLLLDWRFDHESMQIEQHRHRGMRDGLVAVDEGVVHRESKCERTSLVYNGGIKVGSIECGAGLCERRFERAQIADAIGAPCGGQNGLVERHHLAERQVAHAG